MAARVEKTWPMQCEQRTALIQTATGSCVRRPHDSASPLHTGLLFSANSGFGIQPFVGTRMVDDHPTANMFQAIISNPMSKIRLKGDKLHSQTLQERKQHRQHLHSFRSDSLITKRDPLGQEKQGRPLCRDRSAAREHGAPAQPHPREVLPENRRGPPRSASTPGPVRMTGMRLQRRERQRDCAMALNRLQPPARREPCLRPSSLLPCCPPRAPSACVCPDIHTDEFSEMRLPGPFHKYQHGPAPVLHIPPSLLCFHHLEP